MDRLALKITACLFHSADWDYGSLPASPYLHALCIQGASALSVAAQQGNRELVVLLLRMGAEPSLKDLAGRTALDVATMYGHDTIRAVLQVCCLPHLTGDCPPSLFYFRRS